MADRGGALGATASYLQAVQVLEDACVGIRDQESDDLLACDPDWQIDFPEPPDEVMAERIDRWLATLDAPGLGATTGVAPVSELREANGTRLRMVLARHVVILQAWLGRRGRQEAPKWTADPSSASDRVTASGRLDFEVLADDGLIGEASKILEWPTDLAATADLAALGLTERDLEEFRNEAVRRQAEEARRRQGVDVDGRVITVDAPTITEDLAWVMDQLGEDVLGLTPAEIELGAAPSSRGGRSKHGKNRRGNQGRPSRQKTEAIGLVGEAIAFAWLRRHFGAEHVSWVSTNRAYYLHDGNPGDDSRGYDFHVTAGRNPIFIEVKASTGDPGQFELSEGEVEFARSKSKTSMYRVMYLANVGTPEDLVLLMLPNPLAVRVKDRYRVVSAGTKYAFSRRDK
jgi:hypothetical protein